MTTIATDQMVLHLAHAALQRGSFMATPPMDLHATDFTIATYLRLSSLDIRNILLGNWPAGGGQMLFAVDGTGAPTIELCKYTRGASQRVEGAPIGGIVFGDEGKLVKVNGIPWPAGGPVTVEFWSCTSDVTTSVAFSLGNKHNPDRFLANAPWSDSMLVWDYGNSEGAGRCKVDYRAYTKKWTHVALVSEGVAGSAMRIYLNGEPMASTTRSGAPTVALTGLTIGTWYQGHRHSGEIAEFRIWSRARTQAEIQELMRRVPPAGAQGLVGYWPLDEGQGVVAHDRSSNGRHGDVTVGTKWVTEAVRRGEPERPRFQETGDPPLVSLISDKRLKATTWHHVAVTFTWGADRKSPTCTLYVDGSPAGRVSPAVAPNDDLVDPYVLRPSGAPYLLGQKQDGLDDHSACSGQLRDLRVFTTALAPEKIATLAFEDRKRLPDVISSNPAKTDDLTQILGLDYVVMGALHRRNVLTFEDLIEVPLVALKQMLTEERCFVLPDELLLTWPVQARLFIEIEDAAEAARRCLDLTRGFKNILTRIFRIDNPTQGALFTFGVSTYEDLTKYEPDSLRDKLKQYGIPLPHDMVMFFREQGVGLDQEGHVPADVLRGVHEVTRIPAEIPLSFLLGIDHQVQMRLYEIEVRNLDELSEIDPAQLRAQLTPIWPPETKHSITSELLAEWRTEASVALCGDLTGLRLLKEAASKALGIARGSGAFPTS